MGWMARSTVALVAAAWMFELVDMARADTAPPRTIAQAITGLERREGLAPIFVDAKGGRVFLVLTPEAGGDLGRYLYQVYMRAGLGSTPVGIDRSNPGVTRILAFRRAGPRVMAEYENTTYRAELGDADEKQAVRDSFPSAIVWSGEVAAEDSSGAVLVDISGFLTRDAFGVTDELRAARQGEFKLDPDRSYPDLAEIHAFPDNLEFEARQTFSVSAGAGDEVRGTAPDSHAVTLVEHQSLIRLPAPGFVPRPADPRTGAISIPTADYGAPIGSPIVRPLAIRFRLEKTDPTAARSPVKKPIVFYVDRAAPEPVRSALIQGASWWAEAFDAAGFENAFRVELLPEGASPLDARYNVINWVHRRTRGWSYGHAVVDPRTGEIIKGSVLLGSLRARQDLMIFQGLVGADRTGGGATDDPLRATLARMRQLATHETGHSIGLLHNFAASTYGDRASVMDYPGPRVGIVAGRLDFADAYKAGIGDWDRFAIRWLYSQVPAGEAGQAALEAIVRDGYAHGLRYVRDEDARPTSSAHPDGAMWDDGPDAVASLAHTLEVRRIALSHFGPASLPAGAPLSDLRRVIVPVYLFHRYEVDSVAKSIGGVDFTYGVRGDTLASARPVDGTAQRRALDALLATLDPALLDLSDGLITQLSAGRDGPSDRAFEIELFAPDKTPAFQIGDAARAAADITFDDLLDPARLSRVADQGARDPTALGLSELLARTIDRVFDQAPLSARRAQLRRVVRERLIVQLASVMSDPAASPDVTEGVRAALDRLDARLAAARAGDPADLAQARRLASLLQNHVRDDLAALAAADADHGIAPPPGMPIGSGEDEDDWFGEVRGSR